MDAPLLTGDSPEAAVADAASSSAASASSSGPASRGSRPHKGVRLRRRRRRRVPPLATPEGGVACSGDGDGDGGVQDLALPLGMSFAAVLAACLVLDRKNGSGERLQPYFLSKICTSAVKESLANTYGDRVDSFMKNFEKSFGSTLRTLHLINGSTSQCLFKRDDSVAVNKSSGVDSQGQIHEVEQNMFLDSVENRLVIHRGDNQHLAHLSHSRYTNEDNQRMLNTVERSVKEQARSNELKEFEIGLNMRRLQLKQSELALSSCSHMLERIKVSLGFQKASFKGEKFKTQMQDTRHAELLKMLTDFLVTAVIIMSSCFGYGTYIYSYQRITAVSAACAAASKGSKSWWVPNSVSSFNSGLLFLRCHLIAATRMSFVIIMILAIAWLIFQRSGMTTPSMPITFNFMLLGVVCGFAGRLCVDTLGGDGNAWLIYWEVLCSIHLLGNSYPSLLYRILYGPISISRKKEAVRFSYWARRCIFYVVLVFVLPTLTGLLPFASLSGWKEHFAEQIKPMLPWKQNEA